MRLALGVPVPASFISSFITQPLMPLLSSGFGGAFVSATSTSPLGSTKSQRGWSSPSANWVTFNPAAGVGVTPAGQPTTLATLTVGISVDLGGGSFGLG